jgi:hypothetical protein
VAGVIVVFENTRTGERWYGFEQAVSWTAETKGFRLGLTRDEKEAAQSPFKDHSHATVAAQKKVDLQGPAWVHWLKPVDDPANSD